MPEISVDSPFDATVSLVALEKTSIAKVERLDGSTEGPSAEVSSGATNDTGSGVFSLPGIQWLKSRVWPGRRAEAALIRDEEGLTAVEIVHAAEVCTSNE